MKVRFVTFHNKMPEGHAAISKNIIRSALIKGVNASTIVTYGAASIKGMLSTLTSPRNGDVDIVHVLNINEFYVLPSRCISKAKIVKHVFYPYLGRVRDMPKHIAYLRIALLRSNIIDYIITINRWLVQYLKSLGISRKKICYIPSPIDTERFKPMPMCDIRSKYGIPTTSKLIVYVGAIEPVRGVFTLVKAFSKVSKYEPDAKLIICSPEVPYEILFRPKLIDLINELNLSEKIIMWGRSVDIEEVYNLADVVALPFEKAYAITDPPLVFLEAMACGKVVLTTPVGAIREVAINGKNAMLTKTCDVGYLSDALHEALNNDESEAIGEEARRVMENKFSIESVGEKMVKIYDEIAYETSK